MPAGCENRDARRLSSGEADLAEKIERGVAVPYLNCPQCGLSIHSAAAYSTFDECPRCAARIARKVPLFRSELPYRLLTEKDAPAAPEPPRS